MQGAVVLNIQSDQSHGRAKNAALGFSFILICAGIFVVPTPLRELMFGEIGRAVNFFTWGGMFLALLSMRPSPKLLQTRAFPFVLAFFLAALLVLGVSPSMRSYIPLDLIAYVAPVLVVLLASETGISGAGLQLLPIWSKFANAAVIVIAAGGLVDLVSNAAASRFFTEMYGAESYTSLLSQGRMVSFYGHALTSAVIIIVAFCASYLLSIVRGRKIPISLLLLYVPAMALTTSKSGMVLILAAIVLTSFQSGRWRNIFISLVALGAAFSYGLLDVVLARFDAGFASGDITTGRNLALEQLFGAGGYSFGLFTGQVIDNSNFALVAALEYPLLRFAFRYGILFACVFAIGFFVLPMLKLLKSKPRTAFISWGALFIVINTYSGISAFGDVLLLFSITTLLAIAAVEGSSQSFAPLEGDLSE